MNLPAMNRPSRPGLRLLSASLLLTLAACTQTANAVSVLPVATVDEPVSGNSEVIVFSGGCFWGVQGVFQHVRGVTRAVSGYAGGQASTAHYEMVSGGDTGHAESVQVTFDPHQVSLGELLRIFFSVAHDPTELNAQGPDTGTQYRSAIFFTTPAQQQVASAYMAQLGSAGVFRSPIVTQLNPLKGFYPAETYHQDYATLHPDWPYIYLNDLPKITALKRMYPQDYRDQPVLVTR